LLIALASTVLACLLGVLAAFALVAGSPNRRFALALLALSALPLLVPNYILVSFWMEALGANGWLSRLIADGNAVTLTGLWPTMLVLALIYWSPVALICYFTLTRMDRAMIEAADLSLGKTRARLQVVAPLLWPSVAAGAALVFVLTFSNFSVPATFQVRTIQNEIYVQFNTNFDVSAAFLAAMPQLISVAVVGGLLWCIPRRRPWIAVTARHAEQANVGGASVRRLLGVLFLAGLMLLSAGAPLLRSFNAVFQGKVLWQTLIVSAHQIWNSFWFAILAATIIVFLSFLTICIGRPRPVGPRPRSGLPHWQPGWHALLLVPFVLPEVLIGISLIALFNRPSLQVIYTSVAIVLIAFVVRYFIVGKLAVSVGRSHLDPSLLEAAELAGLSRISMFWKIQLPLLSRWLFAGWWLVYLFCLADVGSLVLIYPPGCDTVPIRIFNLLHYGYDAQVSALCLVMLVLGAVPMILLPRISRMVTNDRVRPT
jgi:iron(III) transport system permease protein